MASTSSPVAAARGVRLGSALFNGDHGRLAEEVVRVEEAGLDFLHVDVFDGHFVPDLGISPRTIETLRSQTRLPFEIHLGAIDPLRFVPQLAEAGVDLVLIHVESVPLLYEAIVAIRECQVRVGLVFTLGTSLALLDPVVSPVDAVLLLSRVTGEGARGASFNHLVLPRLCAVRDLVAATGENVDIQVAGGVNLHHVADVAGSGATALALGAGLYRSADMALEVRELRSLIRKGR